MKCSTFLTALSIPLLGALACPARGQGAPADTARFARHHLGLTASPQLEYFFVVNRRLPVGLLYKHQNRAGHATRYGVVLRYDHDSRTNVSSPSTQDSYSFNYHGVDAYVGREFSRLLARRWVGTAGCDVGLGFSRSVSERNNFNGGNALVYDEYNRQQYHYYSAMLRPFAGLRYYAKPWLYVSAETAIQLLLQRSNIDAERVTKSYSTGETLSRSESNWTQYNGSLRLQLIQQITLHYTFPNP